ncbi:TIGR03862 family flavoprotein [Comamonas jiangduensis]|uniref:TIGR03862 family flavoprotein n=1 Tax=Comamonas jiangduensis TaxID=1194168 RepID=A0ABV4IDG7_9BURK
MSAAALLPALKCDVAIVGAGPAGLMAAEVLSAQGVQVHVFDGKASVGRKFLLAGKGGLNLTHSEAFERFVERYGDAQPMLRPLLQEFDADTLRAWAQGLGVGTFVGTSGRVFPSDMKAAPLLRAWLARLRAQGVVFHMRHLWKGWNADQALLMDTQEGVLPVQAKATLLALGGGSWARLGSDGAWVPLLQAKGVDVASLQSANCGFDVGEPAAVTPETAIRRDFFKELVGAKPQIAKGWSAVFGERFAGAPLKSVAIHFTDSLGRSFERRGEFVVTATGVEGSLIYAVSNLLRDEITRTGSATFALNLLPAFSPEKVLQEVRHPRGARSLSSHLKGRLGLDGVKAGLLYEVLSKETMQDPVKLAQAIQCLPITVVAARPMDEAISTAGGVTWAALDEQLMCKALPGVFCAGEMVDWEAPTGGYLLTACFATGARAARGIQSYLQS